jgi:hypothetical protein
MKALLLMPMGALLVATFSGCGSSPPASGSGGSTAAGGATGSGGSVGTGGTTIGTGGTTGSGGATSAGGSTGSGGSTGTGGGGGPDAGTGTGGSAPLTSIVGAWDGALLTFPCQDHRTGYDCTNVGCVGGTSTVTKTYPIGGQANTVYNVTFRVRGVVESYAYVGGTRASGTLGIVQSLAAPTTGLFATGGAQQPVTNGGDYNTYQLTVTPAVTGVTSNTYYLNSVIASENPHTNATTQHTTFPIDYTATIKVMGGGTVTFTSFDSNCALVQNCGPGVTQNNNTCGTPVQVSLAGAMPAAPTTFMQPFQAPTGSFGQWLFFDVTAVSVGP